MANSLINFNLDSAAVANPDGTFSTTFTGTSVVPGPGSTIFGNFPKALDFGTSGKAATNIVSLPVNLNQFCINVVFNASNAVTSRQNLVESTLLPFSINLTTGNTASKFNLNASIKPKFHEWSGPDTMFKTELNLNKWYAVSLVYDFDTVALFINEELVAVHAFPNGLIEKLTGGKLFFGTWVDGIRDQFKGKFAAFQLYDGIPSELENLLDERRNHAEWFITYKYEDFRKNFNVGVRTKALTYLSTIGAHIQYYERSAIMYHPSLGVALEMHGAIYEKYKTITNSESLGFLICDESNTTKAGGKKSLFSKGGIYWSGSTGALPVTDKIYAEYENLGESKNWGFPIKVQKAISNGFEQEFQNCRFYYKNGQPKAKEVHGAILTKFLAVGGVSKWGYPVSNESDINKGSSVIGKYSEFEFCTIYWSGSSGAFEVHGEIREKYKSINGPLSDLGFPTSDEINIPNFTGTGKMNTFQKGSILWYGSYNSIKIARPFKLFIGRIDSKESEGFGRGQNDLYIKKLKVTQNGAVLYEKRHPSSGSWGGKNIVNVNITIPNIITPNNSNIKVKLYLDIWEDDSPTDADDHMGTYEKILEASNAWGLRDNDGIYNAKFGKINSLTWSVKPEVNINTLSYAEKWWGVKNRSSSALSYSQYASAFKGVDSEAEWWDVTDWLEKAFYEAAVKNVSKKGNCFGMSLEGIYSWKGKSLFSMPLNRFTTWNTLENEFKIKHSYQVGANPIWWIVGQFLTGNTHDPVDVFNNTMNEFNHGKNPVICITQNYDFSGAAHAIMPVKWDKSTKPWKITILDPNFTGTTKELTVNPDNNTFKYVGSKTYSGGEWSGGRFYYMPFSILDEKQRVPFWDLILLLIAGTIIILADDAETVSITDTNGNDLNAFGTRAMNMLKSGNEPSEFFVGINGFDTDINPGQILVRKEIAALPSTTSAISSTLNLPISVKTATRGVAALSQSLGNDKITAKIIEGRSAQYILSDKTALSQLKPDVVKQLNEIVNVNSKRNFIHTIKGNKNGKLNYYIKSGFNEIKLESVLNLNETHKLEVNDLATNFCKIKLNSPREKKLTVEIKNNLGVNGDYLITKIRDYSISPANNFEINIKQGIGGVEVINKGIKTNLNVSITSKLNNKISTKSFLVPMDKGVRLKPSSVLTREELTFSSIADIFGKVIQTYRIKNI